MSKLKDDLDIFVNVDNSALFNSIYELEKLSVEITTKDKKIFKLFDVDIERCLKICLNQIAHELRQLVLACEDEQISRDVFYKALIKVDFGEAMSMGIANYLITVADERETQRELEYLKRVMERRETKRVSRF